MNATSSHLLHQVLCLTRFRILLHGFNDIVVIAFKPIAHEGFSYLNPADFPTRFLEVSKLVLRVQDWNKID